MKIYADIYVLYFENDIADGFAQPCAAHVWTIEQ